MLKAELLENGMLKVTGDNKDDIKAIDLYMQDLLPASLNKSFLQQLDNDGWILFDLFDDCAYFHRV